MKVQGSSITSTLMKEYAFTKEQNNNQKVWKQEDGWGQPVQVTFSEEGIESLRKRVVEIGGDQTYKDFCPETVMDLTSTYSMEMISANGKAKSEEKGHTDDESTKDKYYKTAYNYLDYYAKKYDEIVKGYEDGTREFWISDQNSELGFRRVTKEDELDALDKAFERNVEFEDTQAKLEPMARMAKKQALAFYAELHGEKFDSSQMPDEEPIEKLYERMMESRNQFKNRYSSIGVGTQEERNQNLTKLIDEIFQSQFSW